jgi:pSer/pThr/pTyr-binding forkhead associated (FHA) protein
MWKLVIEDDEAKRTVVPLTREDYTLGRKEGNTIRLTERNVSRTHGRLFMSLEKGVYVVEDFASYNGVHVNGLRVIQSQDLSHGDLLQIGDYRILLQDDTVADGPGSTIAASDAKTTLPSVPRGSLLLERPNRLVMLAGPTSGAEFPLEKNCITIGRAEDMDVSVVHSSVSRLHCEVHALGDGRYEIVDQGSANGVRVNGADLKRSIIEAGDVIELGDVKFKFVGAGQIFRPGPEDSRESPVRRPQRRAGFAPYLLVAGILLLVAVAAWLTVRWVAGPPRQSLAAVDNPELETIRAAKRLCGVGEFDTAHEKLQNELRVDSPLRRLQDFREIEDAWATDMLARARAETDPDRRNKLLAAVAKSTDVSPGLRSQAGALIGQFDAPGTNPQDLPLAVLDVTKPDAKPDGAGTRKRDAGQSTGDHSRQHALDSPEAMATYRRSLEARVFAGQGTDTEVATLLSICRDQKDPTCVRRCQEAQKKP